MEVVKQTIKVGNSAGVLLPREWLNSTVKISRINAPKLSEIEELVDLKKAQGVYLAGSYARGEQKPDSDIDILILTKDFNKSIKKGKYEVTYVAIKSLKGKNLIIYYPMMLESKTLFNEELKKELLESLKNKLNKDLLKKYIKDTKDMLRLNEKFIKLDEMQKLKYSANGTGYSLVLRLRTYYILECIKKNKMWSQKDFLKMIEQISGSLKIYESYMIAKNNLKDKDMLPVQEARKMLEHLKNLTKKWEKEKKFKPRIKNREEKLERK